MSFVRNFGKIYRVITAPYCTLWHIIYQASPELSNIHERASHLHYKDLLLDSITWNQKHVNVLQDAHVTQLKTQIMNVAALCHFIPARADMNFLKIMLYLLPKWIIMDRCFRVFVLLLFTGFTYIFQGNWTIIESHESTSNCLQSRSIAMNTFDGMYYTLHQRTYMIHMYKQLSCANSFIYCQVQWQSNIWWHIYEMQSMEFLPVPFHWHCVGLIKHLGITKTLFTWVTNLW